MGHSLKVIFLKFALILLLVSLFSYYGYKQLGRPDVGVDDANIFMVYAKHFSEGHGLVYNISSEKVEGFSSFLYVLILSLFYKIQCSPERLILLFNILSISCALTIVVVHLDALTYHSSRSNQQHRIFLSFASLLFLTWTFSCPAYICWTTFTLMDSGLWSSLLLLSSVLISRSLSLSTPSKLYKAALCLMIPLLVLARPEALLWIPALLFTSGFLRLLNKGDVRSAASSIAVPFLLFVASELALTGFRIFYFGFPFPNTYYAKISPDILYNIVSGLGYARSFMFSNIFTCLTILSVGGFIVIAIVQAYRAGWSYPSADNYWVIVSSISLVGLFMPVLVGGDHFRWFRFYQPIWPMMVLPLYKVCALLGKKLRLRDTTTSPNWLKYLIICSIFACFSSVATPSWYDFSSPNITHEGHVASRGRRAGEVLNSFFHTSQLPTVGVVSSGGIKYTYEGIVLDLMGLNNIAIAHHPGERYGIRNHAAFSKEVFYQLNPHIVLPRVLDKFPIDAPYNRRWHDAVLKGLLDDEVFKASYTCVSVRNPNDPQSVHLCAYMRNDYLKWLKSEGLYSVSLLNEKKAESLTNGLTSTQ